MIDKVDGNLREALAKKIGRPVAAGRGNSFEEADVLRDALDRIQDVLMPHDDAKHTDTVGRAREIALAALNQ